jgi:CheY-like chemotaxis protein
MRRKAIASLGAFLLDQDLPYMEGLAVLQAVRESENRADVPIVIVSADAAPGQQKRALSAGQTTTWSSPSPSTGCSRYSTRGRPLPSLQSPQPVFLPNAPKPLIPM